MTLQRIQKGFFIIIYHNAKSLTKSPLINVYCYFSWQILQPCGGRGWSETPQRAAVAPSAVQADQGPGPHRDHQLRSLRHPRLGQSTDSAHTGQLTNGVLWGYLSSDARIAAVCQAFHILDRVHVSGSHRSDVLPTSVRLMDMTEWKLVKSLRGYASMDNVSKNVLIVRILAKQTGLPVLV